MGGKAKKEVKEDVKAAAVAAPEKSTSEVSREEVKSLFATYEEMSTNVEALNTQLAEARRELSDHIKKICEALKSNGPFNYKGRSLIASHKGETWFFKTRSSEAVVID